MFKKSVCCFLNGIIYYNFWLNQMNLKENLKKIKLNYRFFDQVDPIYLFHYHFIVIRRALIVIIIFYRFLLHFFQLRFLYLSYSSFHPSQFLFFLKQNNYFSPFAQFYLKLIFIKYIMTTHNFVFSLI